MHSHSILRLVYVLCVSLLALPGCGESGDNVDVVKREGQPDYIRSKDEQLMARAVAKAKDTQAQFVAAIKKPDPRHRGHAVKKPFATPSGGQEHIWINDVTWDGESFSGVINNEPVDTKQIKLGDRVKVKPAELSDWMYVDGNRIVGGYTIRVLHYQQSPEQQKAFTDHTGLVVPPVDF